MLAAKMSVRRSLIVSLVLRFIPGPVAGAVEGLQRGPAERPVDLVGQRADVDVRDPGGAAKGEGPAVLDEGLSRHDVVWPAHQVVEKRDLGGGEVNPGSGTADLGPCRIQGQVADADNRGPLPRAAAQQGPHPGEEFSE